jgi:SAM-dependent methyltransferase
MATIDIAVDPSNRAAFQAWNGSEGDHWVDNDELYEAGLARYGSIFFAAADIRPGDRVLDVGCGNGSTTCEAARRAAYGSALGVDLSARMIERGRHRAVAAGLGNVEFLQADAQIHPFAPTSFDQVISRTGVMFFGEPTAAFSNIARAIRRSGRLTLLVWQDDDHNPWIGEFAGAIDGRQSQPQAPDDSAVISFARPDQVESLLTCTGFVDIRFDPVSKPISFGPDPETAFRFVRDTGFVKSLLDAFEESMRPQALDALRESLETHAVADGVLYPSAMWLIIARRA